MRCWPGRSVSPGPARPDISEVQVDAVTGKIATKAVGTPKNQAKEAAADMRQQSKP